MKSKIEDPTHCFSSYENHKLKVKQWWVGACKRKKRAFFVPFSILYKGNFFEHLFRFILLYSVPILYVFRIYIQYFQNIHTFAYSSLIWLNVENWIAYYKTKNAGTQNNRTWNTGRTAEHRQNNGTLEEQSEYHTCSIVLLVFIYLFCHNML